MWLKEHKPNTAMGGKRQNQRIFKGAIRDRACALLLLVTLSDEAGKNRIAQSLLYGLGVFVYA